MKFIEFQTDKGGNLEPVFINAEYIVYFELNPEKDTTTIAFVGGNFIRVKNSFPVVREKLNVDNPVRRGTKI
jgi:uncharacterized protein YlzI (FlbEa/FlbD family)